MNIKKKLALELARILSHNERRLHSLQQLFWESTVRCNISCRHCGSDCRQTADIPDMPREDFFRVLDGIAAKVSPGDVLVIIGGGEPLVREDIVECAQGICDRGFPWGMVSNGLYLTAELYEKLCKAGLRSLTISLDGLEKEHTWLRRHPDCFRMADEAIDRVVKDGNRIAYDVMTCVHQVNYDQLPKLRDYLIRKGVTHWRLATIFPVGRGGQDERLRLSKEQFRGLMEFIKTTRQQGLINTSYGCEGFLGRYEGEVRDWAFRCVAGVTVGSVLVDGSISACTSIRHNYKQGNIYEDDFMDVWEHRFQLHRDHKWMKRDECANCKSWRYCEGNGLHLRDDDGKLLFCNLKQLENN